MKVYLGTSKYGDFFTFLNNKDKVCDFYNGYTDVLIQGKNGSGKTTYILNEAFYLEATHKPENLKYIVITDKPNDLSQLNNSKHLVKPIVDINNRNDVDVIFDFIKKEIQDREDFLIRQNYQNLDQADSNKYPNIVVFIDGADKLFKNNYFDEKHIFSKSHVHFYNFVTVEEASNVPPTYVHYFPHEICFNKNVTKHSFVYRYQNDEEEKGVVVSKTRSLWKKMYGTSIDKNHAPIKLEICENQLEELHGYMKNMGENARIFALLSMFEFYKLYSGGIDNKYDLALKSFDCFNKEIANASKEKVLETKEQTVNEILNMFKDKTFVDCIPVGDDIIQVGSGDYISRLKYYCELIEACNNKLYN